METHPLTPPLEELLSQAGWLRTLALQLVRDPHAADDLSQEVLQKALARPPRDGRPLRPWLGTVLRNAWRERHRKDGRRRDRELRSVRDASADPTDDLVAKVELERKLAGLVLELAEPYRATLLLRFWEGLEPSAIAERLNEPPGTVRWRLKQGLDRLRALLDARHEGRREEWIAALAPLWQREAATAGGVGSILFGGLTMTSLLKITTLAAAGALALWLPFAGGSNGTQAQGEKATGRASSTALAAPDAPLAGTPASTRRPAEVANIAATHEPSAGAPQAASVGARIVDAAGAPVAGATFRGALYGYTLDTQSGADGVVALSSTLITREEEVEFLAVGPDQSSWVGHALVAPGQHVLLGDLQLAPRASVSVRVRAGLLPVSNAVVVVSRAAGEFDEVRALRFGSDETELARGETGLLGKVRVDGVLPGRVRVWCRARGKAWTWTEAFDLAAGQHREGIALRLVDAPPPSSRLVRVVDSAGEPVSGCSLRAVSTEGLSTFGSTDGRGEQRVTFPDGRLARVAAFDATGRVGEAFADEIDTAADAATSDEPLTLVMDAAVLGKFVVTGPGGEPLEGVSGSVRWVAGGQGIGTLQESEVPGTFLAPLSARPFHVRLQARHHAQQELGPFTRSSFPQVLHAQLAPLPGLRGRVVAAGEPVAGAEVVVKERLTPATLGLVDGVPSLHDPVGMYRTKTDSAGRFHLDVRESAELTLFAEKRGVGAAAVGPLQIDARVGRADLEVVLEEAGAIEGTLRRADGLSPAGLIVAVTSGDGEPRTQRTRADGAFRFEDVRAGDWYVYLHDRELTESRSEWSKSPAGEPWVHPFNCFVRAGATTVHDIDFRVQSPVTVTGSWKLNGAPQSGWKVRFQRSRAADPFHEPDRPQAAPDGDGEFALELRGPGRYEVRVSPASREARLFMFTDRVEVGAGGFDWRADVATGALAGHVAANGERLEYVWRDGSRRALAEIEPAPDGSFRLAVVPAGRARIVRPARGRSGDPWEWELVHELDVLPGVENGLDLR